VLGFACAPAVFPKGVLARARLGLFDGLIEVVPAPALRAPGEDRRLAEPERQKSSRVPRCATFGRFIVHGDECD
jgi:hypothetical protein